jgi:glutamine amidotransferase-like uncharacterized protein
MKALEDHYSFKIFTRHELEDDFFDNVDMIAFPGGIGDADSFDYLTQEHKERIQQFVNRGGRYLGICMGAYWAGNHYFNLVPDIDAVQYITRPNTDTRRPHAKSLAVTWQGQQEKMFFYDGCALIGDETKFQTIARYANGDPMAIIKDRIGLIGCHPESEQHWYENYSWMKKEWHSGKHHAILLDFVNNLMTR